MGPGSLVEQCADTGSDRLAKMNHGTLRGTRRRLPRRFYVAQPELGGRAPPCLPVYPAANSCRVINRSTI